MKEPPTPDCPLAVLQELTLKLPEKYPDATVVINEAGHIVLFNAQAELMFGYAREEILGQPVEILLPETKRDGHKRLRDGYFSNPGVRLMAQGMNLKGRRRNGREFDVEIFLAPAVVLDAGVFGIAVIRRKGEYAPVGVAMS